ncbi:MAG: calcium/sodium antiporter [Bacteroidales bacterium]|nr:calcium/sodium antiporter [Bacteroidales bacterium]
MTYTVVMLVLSLALLVYGADRLVDGSAAIARRAGINEFIIGLTIIGFGTSCPELVVSLTGALEGISDVAVGNVVGSNIFNTLLILGLTAVVMPISVTRANMKVDIPVCIAVSLLLALMGLKKTLFGIGSDSISAVEGVVFLVLFAAYLFYCFKSDEARVEVAGHTELTLPRALLYTVIGLLFLIVGGKCFVDRSVELARSVGVSEKYIAITLLAGGTSLPELVTSIVAVIKGRGQLALGNILGSNVFNILLILGLSSVAAPLSLENMNIADLAVMTAGVLIIWAGAALSGGRRIGRLTGAMLLLCEAGYMIHLTLTL